MNEWQDIPPDVRSAAADLISEVQDLVEEFQGWPFDRTVDVVALGLALERERAASIAEQVAATMPDCSVSYAIALITEAIRSPTPTEKNLPTPPHTGKE